MKKIKVKINRITPDKQPAKFRVILTLIYKENVTHTDPIKSLRQTKPANKIS